MAVAAPVLAHPRAGRVRWMHSREAGSVDGVKGHVSVDLSRAEGSVVLLWITNLGTPVDGTGHRVEIQELVPVGHPADG